MPGKLYEHLVDEIRFGFNTFWLAKGSRYRRHKLACAAEHQTLNLLLKGQLPLIIADYYLYLNDGHHWIPVEVGKMRDGKWSLITDNSTGLPLRVLRAGFDGSVWMLNMRRTQIETDLITFYQRLLPISVTHFKRSIEIRNKRDI
jgi:hypothetical protein